jgi:hypothetical protein
MERHKAGLHKEVSSIFQGVSIPNNDEHSCTEAIPKPVVEPPSASQTSPSTLPKQSEQLPAKADDAEQYKQADTVTQSRIQVWLQQTWQKLSSRLLAPKPGVNPARQKAMMMLVPVLFIVMMVVLFKVFAVAPQRTNKVMASELKAASAAASANIDWQIPQPYPTAIRDPMQMGSVASAQAGTGAMVVKGIVYSVDNPSAIIGTDVVKEGDKISGVTVLKINRDSVEFQLNEKRWTQKVQR